MARRKDIDYKLAAIENRNAPEDASPRRVNVMAAGGVLLPLLPHRHALALMVALGAEYRDDIDDLVAHVVVDKVRQEDGIRSRLPSPAASGAAARRVHIARDAHTCAATCNHSPKKRYETSSNGLLGGRSMGQ
ncbi:MAG: hypothetical protein SGPRY_008894 [Prymnesium sp.]